MRTIAAGVLITAALTMTAADLRAQPAADAGRGASPRCAFQRREAPEYVLWVCNAEGTAYAEHASILRARTNRTGTEVVSRIWSGPLSELVRDVEAIIASHRQQHARCSSYFHLARAGRPAPAWNVASRPMQEWWAREGSREFENVCYTSEPSTADYIVMWTGHDAALPDAFSVELPAADGDADGGDEGADDLLQDDSRAVASLAVYQVNPGFDGSVLRLGPTVLAVEPPAWRSAPETEPFLLALRFLSRLPR